MYGSRCPHCNTLLPDSAFKQDSFQQNLMLNQLVTSDAQYNLHSARHGGEDGFHHGTHDVPSNANSVTGRWR